MLQNIVGRTKEKKQLKSYLTSTKSEFVAVYGRRRIGKTFLIRQQLHEDMIFQMTGIANVGKKEQLMQFHLALHRYFPDHVNQVAADWFSAFRQLIECIERLKNNAKKVIFIDELPWLDTRNAKFISVLEHFWNSWASMRTDILLIVCGSAASWMINHLINNKGGLHNRITGRIKLDPFSLSETASFFNQKGYTYDHYQIILIYMTFGGIPYYLEQIDGGLSAQQNINALCFSKNAIFRSEYSNLYSSLFNRSERHTAIIAALSKKNKGLTRSEIIKLSKYKNGGGLSRILGELEESGFIRKYRYFGKRKRESLYQLTDLYSLFYHNFIRDSSPDDEHFWTNNIESPSYRSWSGYAFEMVCLHHTSDIKSALGISGVQTSISSWHNENAQVDLVIDRKDQVINLCEMKFSIHEYSIDKKYADSLRNKIGSFTTQTASRKAIFLTMITSYGVTKNKYSGMVQNDLTMEIFFNENRATSSLLE